MSVVREFGATNFITSLRALAATLVIIIHTDAFSAYGNMGENFTSGGKNGVDIFFVISGFAVSATLFRATSYSGYLVRRLFRIVPLYYFFLFLASILSVTGIRDIDTSAYNLIMHFSFLNNLDYSIVDSILGVEWTLSIEVFWYLFLPLILIRVHSWKHYFIAVFGILGFVTTVAAGAAAGKNLGLITDPGAVMLYFPARAGLHFILGFAAYRLRQTVFPPRFPANIIAGGAIIGIFLALLLNPAGRGSILAILSFVLIGFHRFDATSMIQRFSTNAIFLSIGSVSYSLYLWHPLVIDFFQSSIMNIPKGLGLFAAVFPVTFLLSFLSCVFIERPTIRLGHRVSTLINRA